MSGGGCVVGHEGGVRAPGLCFPESGVFIPLLSPWEAVSRLDLPRPEGIECFPGPLNLPAAASSLGLRW